MEIISVKRRKCNREQYEKASILFQLFHEAQGVIVFVADGLRAASFLEHQANRTIFLRQTVLSQGVFGISHTRVPTESRPGHVALFAGMYEDPSAVFKGWKKNPVDFDSVFNRSNLAFSWGSPDVLSIFSNEVNLEKVKFVSYSADYESFSSSANTSLLDVWVFERVKTFLAIPHNQNLLRSQKKVILFLHLLGLDTAGHIHKPDSILFSENLVLVDKGIEEIVRIIDQITNNDRRTSYIFTSDHGMTDRGSHGSGDPMETDTPFIAWGAGIQHWKNVLNGSYQKHIALKDVNVPSLDINQADVTPFISTLLGIAIPRNNFGKLPQQFLNISDIYAARSMEKNTDQLLHQYYRWQENCNRKLFKWPLSTKESNYMKLIETLQKDIEHAKKIKQYKQMITSSESLMDVVIAAIEFYQTYYKYELLLALTFTMIGWILFIVRNVFINPILNTPTQTRSVLIALVVVCIICLYNTAQGTPKTATFLFSLPVCMWIPVIPKWKEFISIINKEIIYKTVLFFVSVELCVVSFFQHQALSGVLIVNTIFMVHRIYKKSKTQWLSLSMHMLLSNAFLAIFPLIPITQQNINNPYLLVSGILVWAILTLNICFFFGENKMYCWVQIVLTLSTVLNMLHCFSNPENTFTVNRINQILSWLFFVLSLITPLLTSTSLQIRYMAVVSNFAGPYMMLSLSYEPVFLLSFSLSLFFWIRAEDLLYNSKLKMRFLNYSDVNTFPKPSGSEDIRRALTFVLYMLISFFGPGNIATISSFDPNWVRLFVSTFSPFLMTGLIVFKLLIPLLVLVCAFKSLHVIAQVNMRNLFLLILIICDVMCMNFFYFVKNKGSWLEIGTTISQFVIMECVIIVLICLYGVAKLLTEVTFTKELVRPTNRLNYLLPFNNKQNKD
ncbi:GPI ethanolamine phosphate transferase 1 isoform X2 [Wyeomyia smithii]|uniref:GPI ethanolamine phosphate transferase 1 isoform X2 n=1 Tax=Wyeomyia smithii TaxID=174621 RepID=UPI002467B648|nr:GPI ethanolamine phosphate transferase 1 isoform X2 [Wyeomyia smithii]